MNYHSDVNRGSGRTTRIVDYAVQLLISTGGIYIPVSQESVDRACQNRGDTINNHHIICDHENNTEANKYLLGRIRNRIKNEHPSLKIHVNGPFVSIISNIHPVNKRDFRYV